MTIATRAEASVRVAPSGSSLAAMICGMPDPRAAGASRPVIQAIPANASGVMTSGIHHSQAISRLNASLAWSAARAKKIAISPTATAPPKIAARRRHGGA